MSVIPMRLNNFYSHQRFLGHFHGSVFVTIHARIFLESTWLFILPNSATIFTYLADFLFESLFLDDIDHIVRIFDTSTKLRFNNAEVHQYVKFGSTRDNDPLYNIRFGQLKLAG